LNKRYATVLVVFILTCNLGVTSANALQKCNRAQTAKIMILDSWVLSAKANLSATDLELKAAQLSLTAAQLRLDQVKVEISRVRQTSFLRDTDLMVVSSSASTLNFLTQDQSEAEGIYANAKIDFDAAKEKNTFASNRVQKRIAASKAVTPNCLR